MTCKDGIAILENISTVLKENYPQSEIILLGDFNVKTGNKFVFIEYDNIDHLPIDESTCIMSNDCPQVRYNKDASRIFNLSQWYKQGALWAYYFSSYLLRN